MRARSLLRRHGWAALAFAVVAPLYFAWACHDGIGFLGSDGPAYLVMARHYLGGGASGSAVELAGTFSRFPPLYALVLAYLHAAESLVLAHAVSIALLLLGLLALYAWLVAESGQPAAAALLTLLYAMLPGSWLLALSLQSEFLYLPLSCACLACLAAYRARPRDELLYLASLALAAAMLTRAVGLVLLLPLALGAWRAPRRTRLLCGLIAFAPYLLWYLLHRSGHDSYAGSLLGYYHGDAWAVLRQQLGAEAPALRAALESSLTQDPAWYWLADALGLLALAATAWRAARRHAEAAYLLAYLGIVLLWPFDTYDAARYLWPVLGLLLAQPLLVLLQARRPAWAAALLALPLGLSLPAVALAAQRFHDAADSGIPGAAGIRYWYDLNAARAALKTAGEAMETGMLRDLGQEVPPGACVIAIRPDLINYFANRLSGLPPDDAVADADFDRRLHHLHCAYLFMTSARYTGYEQPLHPLQKLHEKIRVVDYRELPPAAPGAARMVCILARFETP
jgi:hypothetical protein